MAYLTKPFAGEPGKGFLLYSDIPEKIEGPVMDEKILDWLAQGPPWMRYAAQLQLQDLSPEVAPVLTDPQIGEIVSRLKDPKRGIAAMGTGYMSSDEYENPYWDLYFLADLGLCASDLGLNRQIERFLETQSPDGTYFTEMGMQPSYFCKSVILLSSIARLGYQDDRHIRKLVQLFLDGQRLDGGWYCNPNHDIGAALQDEPSCPQDNLNILMLLGQYDKYRTDPRFKGAADLLLKHWELRRTGAQIVYFGVGKRYQALQYPATRYGILRVLDALSLFPFAVRTASFHSMLDFVRAKAVDGKYRAETPTPYTDLEPQADPSRLITFIVARVEKRVSEIG